MFTEEELSRLLDEAVSEYVNEGLESLVDKGLVGMGVREDGEIVYRLSEKGKQTAEKFR
jgi:DNA-binding PadR family transcriptional regulator